MSRVLVIVLSLLLAGAVAVPVRAQDEESPPSEDSSEDDGASSDDGNQEDDGENDDEGDAGDDDSGDEGDEGNGDAPGSRTWHIDGGSVYLGSPEDFSSPAVVRMEAVFGRIPAYEEIVSSEIDDDDPRYWILLNRANRVFDDVVRRVARDRDHDLICEAGGISCSDSETAIPDVTDHAIETIPDILEDAD